MELLVLRKDNWFRISIFNNSGYHVQCSYLNSFQVHANWNSIEFIQSHEIKPAPFTKLIVLLLEYVILSNLGNEAIT